MKDPRRFSTQKRAKCGATPQNNDHQHSNFKVQQQTYTVRETVGSFPTPSNKILEQQQDYHQLRGSSKPIGIRKSLNIEECCHQQGCSPNACSCADSEVTNQDEEEDSSSVVLISESSSVTSSILSSQVVSSCNTTINPFESFALLPPTKSSMLDLSETSMNILAFNPILNSVHDESELLKTFKKQQPRSQPIPILLNPLIMDILSEYPTDGTYDFGWVNPNVTVPNSPVASPSTSPLELASPASANNLLRFALTSNLQTSNSESSTAPEDSKPLSTQLVQTLTQHQEEENTNFPICTTPEEPFFTSFDTMNELCKEHERGDLESFLLSLPPVKKCLCDRKALHCCVCGHVSYGTAKDVYLPNSGSDGNRCLLIPAFSSTLKGKKVIAEKKKELMMDMYRQSQSSTLTARFPIFLSISHNQYLQPPSKPAPKLSIPGTFCCGMTFEIFAKVFSQSHSQYKEFSSVNEMLCIKRDWFCEKEDDDDDTFKKGCFKALTTRNLGIAIDSIKDAIKGDFIQFWRNNGTGHSVIFNSLSEDGTEFEYWSSQRSTKGLGFNKEQTSSISDFYIVRLKDEIT